MAARLFKGKLQPVELATRLVREADLAVAEGPSGAAVPNVFRVGINPGELTGDGTDDVTRELALVLDEVAAERGWRMEGPAKVILTSDPRIVEGTLQCRMETVPGDLAPWAHLLGPRGEARLPLRHVRTLVGRDEAADIRIDEQKVSRRHAVIWREQGEVMIADAGSSNGTTHNGTLLKGAAPLHDGDAVAFGPASFTYRPH